MGLTRTRKRGKKFILIGYRQPTIKLYSIRRSKKKKVLGFGLISMSFIIPDLSLGLLFGLMVLSPVRVRVQLKNKLRDLGLWIRFNFLKGGIN